MKYDQDYESLIDSRFPEENKRKFEDEYTIIEELLISKKVKIYKVQSKKDRLTCRTMHRIQKSSFCNLAAASRILASVPSVNTIVFLDAFKTGTSTIQMSGCESDSFGPDAASIFHGILWCCYALGPCT